MAKHMKVTKLTSCKQDKRIAKFFQQDLRC